MIDRETWIILAERCALIRWLNEDSDDEVELEFDQHDQARVVVK